MEMIRGKQTSFFDSAALADKLAGYNHIHIDIGTGDGRFVRHLAQTRPNTFVIGIDACRENLQDVSRHAPANTLFVIANAQELPIELHGLADHLSINFPWGSLLEGLINNDRLLLNGLAALARPGAALDVRLNGGALEESRCSVETGAQRVTQALAEYFYLRPPTVLSGDDLRKLPTTWAKRLAFGRYPYALALHGTRQTIREVVTVSENTTGY